MTDEQKKTSLLKKLGKLCLHSPINTLFVVAILGMLGYIFVLGQSDFVYKVILIGIILLWALWLVAKYVLTFLLVLGLLGVGGYLYYDYSRKDIVACEKSGGYWNKKTKHCDEKAPSLLEQLQQKWEDFQVKMEIVSPAIQSK